MRFETRHWIFAGLFVLIGLTMASGIRLPTPVSEQTQKMYDYIESLPSGAVLLVSFDHEASSLPEIQPIALALLRHCFERDIHVLGMALMAEGTSIGYNLTNKAAAEYNREYGSDYAFLGFRPQYIAAILSMGESFKTSFPEDYLGRPTSTIGLLDQVDDYTGVVGVLSIADGSYTTHWVEYGGRYNLNVLAGVTSAMVTTYDPYIASGQIQTMISGLRGAAEYENLIGRDGGGARGMLAQSSAHLYVILLIVLGNVSYFVKKRRVR
ncbi:MAG: hypothetical protein OEV49_13400 [candidate division Zixibacteria bacterium]|nr:hypothetical protein [candidate division Zixibacteria bacterium]MDH3938345.1 hypothetical protein [candidate division Zixibacteria bacterium]MDH4034526.1 hypothetical protein [candidate division Zixibacteria bacterium]